MDGPWKVSCRRTVPRGSGTANGEFSEMADAVLFAESWLQPGWTAMITNPEGVQVELEKGKLPVFPQTLWQDQRASSGRPMSDKLTCNPDRTDQDAPSDE